MVSFDEQSSQGALFSLTTSFKGAASGAANIGGIKTKKKDTFEQ